MKIQSIITLASAFLLTGSFAFAESIHLPKAVEYTIAAVSQGEAGNAPLFVYLAQTALTHAEASQKAEANPHTAEAINHLKLSIEVGKRGDATTAAKHAQEAFKHLDLAGEPSTAESVHLPQAVEHTTAAITHGEAGHAPVLVEHAEAALTHAEASQKAQANPHTAEGITHLKAAIDTGKKGDTAGATTHAKEALKHLELAGQSK
jgi:hypothetical protein